MKIEGLTAIVTGGASGLGEATVKRLVQEGANVVIGDLQEELGKKLVESLGKKTIFVKVDVSDEKSCQNLVEKAVEHFGGVHIVVNSAGVLHTGIILSDKCSAKDFIRVSNINVMGTFNVSRFAAIQMVKQKEINEDGERGVIINVASVAGFEGQRGQVIYGATKGAIIAMTPSMARDLGKFGVRVMTIAPGVFETPMGGKIDAKVYKTFQDATPLGKLGQPRYFAEEVVGVVRNPYLTGTVIRVDGGLVLGHL
jgi:NAD(P)-dependent dehydrogenase (short-subunit alcohol dehydrogenase family)